VKDSGNKEILQVPLKFAQGLQKRKKIWRKRKNYGELFENVKNFVLYLGKDSTSNLPVFYRCYQKGSEVI